MNTRIALCDARGPLNDLMDKLSGEEGLKWLRRLSRMLRGEDPFKFHAKDLPVWKTIKLGTHKTTDALKKALMDKGRCISNLAADILAKVTVSPTEAELDLVVVSVAELGFKDGALYEDICGRAQEFGLELCPAETGPQLCLQYYDQPLGEWVRLALKAIRDAGGSLRVFGVELYDDGLWLISICGGHGRFYGGSHRFAFVRPRK